MMAQPLVSTQPRFRLTPRYMAVMTGRAVLVAAIILLIAFHGDLGALKTYGGFFLKGFAHPHAPDLTPLLRAGLAVQIHAGTVLGALALGTVLMIGVKGTLLHRILGWIWVALMLSTAVTTLFIHRENPNGFSLLHIFSFYVLLVAPLAVFAARTHRIALHRRFMTALYVGALLVAGAMSFLPGRIMWAVFFSWR